MATKYYTNGYQQSAQSAGYTSIDQVRALQSDLNKKTATPTTRKKQPTKKSSSGSYYDDSWLYMNHPSGM